MREAIMKKNYRKAFKVIVILAVLLAIFTVVAVPMKLSRQIQDLAALKNSAQEEVLPDEQHGKDWEEEHWKSLITPLSAANYALLGVVTVLWLVLGIYYWLLVIAWLYKSARNEGMNQSLWPFSGFSPICWRSSCSLSSGITPAEKSAKAPDESASVQVIFHRKQVHS